MGIHSVDRVISPARGMGAASAAGWALSFAGAATCRGKQKRAKRVVDKQFVA